MTTPLGEQWDSVSVRKEELRLHSAATPAAGEAPTVLVHGMLSSWKQWRGVMRQLGAELPLVAPDLPGFGLSSSTREPMRFPDFADVLEGLCQRRRWGKIAAVGHSFGGAVVLDWASRYPERFRAIALLAPAAINHPWFRGDIWGLGRPLVARVLGPVILWVVSTRWVGQRMFAHIMGDIRRLDAQAIDDLQWGCRRSREPLRALRYYQFPGLLERLGRIQCPVLFGWGADDRVVPPRDFEVYRAHLPHAEVRWWSGCGHVPVIERPEQTCEVIRWVASGTAYSGQTGA